MTGGLLSAMNGNMDKLLHNSIANDGPREAKSSCRLMCDCQNTAFRKLTVLGNAALDFSPADGVVQIVISSAKEKADEAIESVDRRVKYIQQVLKKNFVKVAIIIHNYY